MGEGLHDPAFRSAVTLVLSNLAEYGVAQLSAAGWAARTRALHALAFVNDVLALRCGAGSGGLGLGRRDPFTVAWEAGLPCCVPLGHALGHGWGAVRLSPCARRELCTRLHLRARACLRPLLRGHCPQGPPGGRHVRTGGARGLRRQLQAVDGGGGRGRRRRRPWRRAGERHRPGACHHQSPHSGRPTCIQRDAPLLAQASPSRSSGARAGARAERAPSPLSAPQRRVALFTVLLATDLARGHLGDPAAVPVSPIQQQRNSAAARQEASA